MGLNRKTFAAAELAFCYAPPNLRSVMPGNKVMLRSGGPCMIVFDIDANGDALCQWEEDGELQRHAFPLVGLTCFGAE